MVGAVKETAFKNGRRVKNRARGGRPPKALGDVLEALFYRLRNAGPWRDLPRELGPWETIYGWYQRLARCGVWFRVLAVLTRKVRGKVRLIDGTHMAAHQCAANPRRDAGPQATGRTRGGRNTKLMVLTDQRGRAVALKLIPGQAYEGSHVLELLDKRRGLLVVGDKGFDSDVLRLRLQSAGHKSCFPGKRNRRKKIRLSKRLYRLRYRVENFFCRIKRWACIATRRDKLAAHFLSAIQFAAIIDWLQKG